MNGFIRVADWIRLLLGLTPQSGSIKLFLVLHYCFMGLIAIVLAIFSDSIRFYIPFLDQPLTLPNWVERIWCGVAFLVVYCTIRIVLYLLGESQLIPRALKLKRAAQSWLLTPLNQNKSEQVLALAGANPDSDARDRRISIDALDKTHIGSSHVKDQGVERPELSDEVPEQIGPFRIREQIGQGGMGVVYVADQLQPVKRTVALKVIRTATPTREILTRFEAERQAVALMDHQNIARIFDAGVAPDGRPWFAMELIDGPTITQYCDQNRLTLRDRMGLFVQACRAIQHAHQKGVIHRDIKPSNVLVTQYDGQPVVKIIDFGLAKALQANLLTEQSLFTQHGQVLGTLEYMSPEQAAMNSTDIDTRSDVYSLGVILYELLTGTTPISKAQMRKEAFDRILRMIREEAAPRPSERLSESKDQLSSISELRQVSPKKLNGILKGGLDWITLKALAKDRHDRYDEPELLADDVLRYLKGEAVKARPLGWRHRFPAFVHMNRKALAFGVILLLACVAAVRILGPEPTPKEASHSPGETKRVSESHRTSVDAQSAARPIAFVLDMSGSMNELLGQEPRYKVALNRLAAAVQAKDETQQASLRVFGHRRGFDRQGVQRSNPEYEPTFGKQPPGLNPNRDSALEVPQVTLNTRGKRQFADFVSRLKNCGPFGTTPLMLSLQKAIEDDLNGKPGVVIAITDGLASDAGIDINNPAKKGDATDLSGALANVIQKHPTTKVIVVALNFQGPARRRVLAEIMRKAGIQPEQLAFVESDRDLEEFLSKALRPTVEGTVFKEQPQAIAASARSEISSTVPTVVDVTPPEFAQSIIRGKTTFQAGETVVGTVLVKDEESRISEIYVGFDETDLVKVGTSGTFRLPANTPGIPQLTAKEQSQSEVRSLIVTAVNSVGLKSTEKIRITFERKAMKASARPKATGSVEFTFKGPGTRTVRLKDGNNTTVKELKGNSPILFTDVLVGSYKIFWITGSNGESDFTDPFTVKSGGEPTAVSAK